MSPKTRTQKPRASNSQLTIWRLTKKKPEQQEIWDLINKKIKAEGKPLKKKPVVSQKLRIAKKFYSVDDEIQRLSKELADIQKSLNQRHPAENDYINKKIADIKAKIKVLGTYKKFKNTADNPKKDLPKITTALNNRIQGLFASFKTYNRKGIGKVETEILKNLNEISENIVLRENNREETWLHFLDYANNIRRLHSVIYSKRNTLRRLIDKFDNIVDEILKE